MKIRTDFVSNSSSSSFIVSVKHKEHPFKEFLKDIEYDSIKNKDSWDSSEFITNIREKNRRNLDYHLNSTELLFLGELSFDDNFVYGVTIPHTRMEYDISFSDPQNETMEQKNKRAKKIVEYTKTQLNEYGEIRYPTELYFISKTTIYNTKALIECGYNIRLNRWQNNLDELLDRLNNGESIYGIMQCQGGDGQDETSIYALGGWYAPFNSKGKYTILHSECC